MSVDSDHGRVHVRERFRRMSSVQHYIVALCRGRDSDEIHVEIFDASTAFRAVETAPA